MREKDLKTVGETVRFFRSSLNITQEQLAEISNFHRTYIGQIERGERNPSLLNLIILCKSLKVSMTEFFNHFEELKNKNND